MSWTEIKKSVNDNIRPPVNKQAEFTKSTSEARQALVNLGYTLTYTFSTYNGDLYVYTRNESLGKFNYNTGHELCKHWKNIINEWAVKNGYGNICISSEMSSIKPSSMSSDDVIWKTLVSTKFNYRHQTSAGDDFEPYLHHVVPLIYII